MLCDRERDIHPSQKLYATIHSEKMAHLTIVFSANVNFQQLYVFVMNNKTSPPSTNPTKKCRALFPYFSSLESRLAGEHTALKNLENHPTNLVGLFLGVVEIRYCVTKL
jgi:hypothetical protein